MVTLKLITECFYLSPLNSEPNLFHCFKAIETMCLYAELQMFNTVRINPDIVSLILGVLTNSEILFLLIVIKPDLSAFRING